MNYKILPESVTLNVVTKRPEKWLLVDRETGEVYQGNPGGFWDKMHHKRILVDRETGNRIEDQS